MSAKSSSPTQRIFDTNILIHWETLDARLLPDRGAITAIRLAELSAGVHAATSTAERAERIQKVQRVESTFEPIPFDSLAARANR